MSRTADVTICIPAYNGERYLDEALKSVLGQTVKPKRVVVWDDCSTDKTLEIANRYVSQGVEVREGQQNVGMVANWNRCAELVNTEFFVLLHQDDRLAESYIEKCVHCFLQRPAAGLVFPDVHIIDQEGNIVIDSRNEIKSRMLLEAEQELSSNGWDRQFFFRLLLKGDFICCPAVMFRTIAFRKAGIFDSRFRQVQDWEYWFRASLKNIEIWPLKDRLFFYRAHTGTATNAYKRDFTKYRERGDLIREVFDKACAEGIEDRSRWGRIQRTVYNVLLWDLAEDLKRRDRTAFAEKLKIGDKEWPDFSRYWPRRMLSIFSFMGSFAGSLAMRFGKLISNRLS